MFPDYGDFTALFADILQLMDTLQLDYVLAAGVLIGLLRVVVGAVRAFGEGDGREEDWGDKYQDNTHWDDGC